MEAARELAQLLERVRQLVARASSSRLRLGGSADLAREAQVQGQRHEALLRAVVEVALERPRASSAAWTIRARDARSSSSWR